MSGLDVKVVFSPHEGSNSRVHTKRPTLMKDVVVLVGDPRVSPMPAIHSSVSDRVKLSQLRLPASILADLIFLFSSSGWHQAAITHSGAGAQFSSSSGSCPVTHSVAKTSVGNGLTSQNTLKTSFIKSHTQIDACSGACRRIGARRRSEN